MPSRWRDATLECTSQPGGFIDGDWIESPYITNTGIRLVQTGNIGVGMFLDNPDSRKFITRKSFAELKCKWVYPADILICRMADPIGRACRVPEEVGPCVTAVDCTIFRPNPEIVSPPFALQVLNWEQHLSQLKPLAGGSTRQRISRSALGRVSLSLPPLPEQRRIAEILDTADEAIRQSEQVIAKLKAVKAGLLHDLLTRGLDEHGRLRDPQVRPEQFKDTPLGRIPASWEACQLSTLVLDHKAGIYKPLSEYGEGVNIVGVSDLYQHNEIAGQTFRLVRLSSQEYQDHRLEAGDLVYAESSLVFGGIAKTLAVTHGGAGTAFAWHTRRLRPDRARVHSGFLAYALSSAPVRAFVRTRATQTALTGIPVAGYFETPVMIPPLREQSQIMKHFSCHDARIRTEEATLAKLRLVKRGLMDDLLTGRVRVQT